MPLKSTLVSAPEHNGSDSWPRLYRTTESGSVFLFNTCGNVSGQLEYVCLEGLDACVGTFGMIPAHELNDRSKWERLIGETVIKFSAT